MKYLERSVAMETVLLPSVQIWLVHELESRGIDSVIYARHIIQLLQQEDTEELEGSEYFDFPFGPKIKSGKKIEKRRSLGHHSTSTEERKKKAAIQCLKAVSEVNSGIEVLVEELCTKLKETSKTRDATEETELSKIQSSSGDSDSSSTELEDPAERYYAAFPALREQDKENNPKMISSPYSEDSVHVWRNNPITKIVNDSDGQLADSGNESEKDNCRKASRDQKNGRKKKKPLEQQGYYSPNTVGKKKRSQRHPKVKNGSRYRDQGSGGFRQKGMYRLASWPQDGIEYHAGFPSFYTPKEVDFDKEELCYQVEYMLKEILLQGTEEVILPANQTIEWSHINKSKSGKCYKTAPSSISEDRLSPELEEKNIWYTQPIENLIVLDEDEPKHERLYKRNSFPSSEKSVDESGCQKSFCGTDDEESSMSKEEQTGNDAAVFSTSDFDKTEEWIDGLTENTSSAVDIEAEIIEGISMVNSADDSSSLGISEELQADEDSFGLQCLMIEPVCHKDDEHVSSTIQAMQNLAIDVGQEIIQPSRQTSMLSQWCSPFLADSQYCNTVRQDQSFDNPFHSCSFPVQDDVFCQELSPFISCFPESYTVSSSNTSSTSSTSSSSVATVADNNQDSVNQQPTSEANSTLTSMLKPLESFGNSVFQNPEDEMHEQNFWPRDLLGDYEKEHKGESLLDNYTTEGKESQLWNVNYQNYGSKAAVVGYPWKNYQEYTWFSFPKSDRKLSPLEQETYHFSNSNEAPSEISSNKEVNTLIPQITFDLAPNENQEEDFVSHLGEENSHDEDFNFDNSYQRSFFDRSISFNEFELLLSMKNQSTSNPSLSKSFELVPSKHSAFQDVVPKRMHHVQSEPNLKRYNRESSPLSPCQRHSLKSHEYECKGESPSTNEHLYFSPKTHFQPINSPVSNCSEEDYHLRDLFGGYSKTSKTPYQKYQSQDGCSEDSFIPMFKIKKEHDKYIQTNTSEKNAYESESPLPDCGIVCSKCGKSQSVGFFDQETFDFEECCCTDLSVALEDFDICGYVDSLTASERNTPQNVPDSVNQTCSDSGYEDYDAGCVGKDVNRAQENQRNCIPAEQPTACNFEFALMEKSTGEKELFGGQEGWVMYQMNGKSKESFTALNQNQANFASFSMFGFVAGNKTSNGTDVYDQLGNEQSLSLDWGDVCSTTLCSSGLDWSKDTNLDQKRTHSDWSKDTNLDQNRTHSVWSDGLDNEEKHSDSDKCCVSDVRSESLDHSSVHGDLRPEKPEGFTENSNCFPGPSFNELVMSEFDNAEYDFSHDVHSFKKRKESVLQDRMDAMKNIPFENSVDENESVAYPHKKIRDTKDPCVKFVKFGTVAEYESNPSCSYMHSYAGVDDTLSSVNEHSPTADIAKVKLLHKNGQTTRVAVEQNDIFNLNEDTRESQGFVPIPNQAVYSADLEEVWFSGHNTPSCLTLRSHRTNSTSKGVKKKPCSFFMEGSCRRVDCKFAHDLSAITCRFWEECACFKGKMCPFLHGYPSDDEDDETGISGQDLQQGNNFKYQFSDFPELTMSDMSALSRTESSAFVCKEPEFISSRRAYVKKPQPKDTEMPNLSFTRTLSGASDPSPKQSKSSSSSKNPYPNAEVKSTACL